jgi:hypothetical protein
MNPVPGPACPIPWAAARSKRLLKTKYLFSVIADKCIYLYFHAREHIC